jgi:transcriptional regulator with XRE-family HTH domain
MAKKIARFQTPNLAQPLSAKLLGQAIKARRTQSQLRLEDAAMLCGVAKHTLMKIEHGNESSQLASILKICSALGISLSIKPWAKSDETQDDWQ